MRIPLIVGVLASSLASHAAAQLLAVHSQALVNDARSHGVIGDQYLSLAETIMLTNGQLSQNALSPAELGQLSGFGTDIAWADIDVRVTPVITFERDLPLIIDRPHGFRINGNFGRAIFEMGDTRGLVSTSNFVDYANLELRRGNHGIHITHTTSLYGSQIENVVFRDQTAAGLRLSCLELAGSGRILLDNCNFDGLRTAIIIDDTGSGGSTTVDLNKVVITNCTIAIDTILGDGGSHAVIASRLSISGAQQGYRIRRPGSAPARSLVFEGRYIDIQASQAAIWIDGHAIATSRLLLQSLDLSSTKDIVYMGPLGSSIDLTLQDSRLAGGGVELLAGSTGQVVIENCIVKNAKLNLGSTGAPVTVKGAIFDRVASATSGSQQVQIEDSRIENSTLSALTAAPLQVTRSHLSNTSTGPQVSVTQPLAAPQLGTCDLSPVSPAVGSILTASVDLPSQLNGIWLFSTAQTRPTTVNGLRLYLSLSNVALLPIAVRGQQQLPLPIPNSPGLIGLELYFQLAVSPDPGFTAPAIWLPPGRRIVLR